MKLASILSEELILCGVEGNNRPNIYRGMLELAAEKLEAPIDPERALDAILEREAMTHLPYEGVALPHAMLPQLQDLYVVVGILREPVMLKDYDLAPTQVVVMSLISENTTATYLRSVAAFVRYLSKPDHLREFAGCSDPEQVIALLNRDDVRLSKTLTAEDLVDANWPKVHPEDRLSVALDACTRSNRSIIPVVDANDVLLGVIDCTEVIKSFIPEYIFMMDNLNFLNSLEVFERIFSEEDHHNVSDYMRPAVAIARETPLIQFTIRLARRETGAMFVIDADQHLLGGINIKEVVRRVLRG